MLSPIARSHPRTWHALALVLALVGCRKNKPSPQVHELEGSGDILPRIAHDHPTTAFRTVPRSVAIGGKKRTYLVVEPTPIEASKRLPLVLVFHGDGGDARGFHEAWPFERATGPDALVAYLDGHLGGWDLETTDGNADVAFVAQVVEELARDGRVDRSRVFGTGYSSGGFLANVVACQRPGLFRAIASNAGGAPYNQLEKWENGYPKCPGQSPTATLALHGGRDFTVTLDSGRFTAEYWAYVNGCRTDEMETTGYPECRGFRGCPAGKAVAFCTVPTLGHWVWDEAAAATWTFFQRQ
jgi:polyhydroxybutyrate depolymerase